MELRVLNAEENPYKKPIREGVVWNKEVQDAFEDGCEAQFQRDIKAFVEWGEERCPHVGSRRAKRQCDKCWQSLKQLVE